MLETIRRIAKEKGFSLNRLEQEAGMSKGLIWKWEETPKSIETIKKIADILDVPVDELIGERVDR